MSGYNRPPERPAYDFRADGGVDKGASYPPDHSAYELVEDDEGYCLSTGLIGANDDLGFDCQQQNEEVTTSYQLATRLANPSNGAPLATIIEQSSHSTLNSRTSLLSVGRVPSARAPFATSSANTAQTAPKSVEETTLGPILQFGHGERPQSCKNVENMKAFKGHRGYCREHSSTTHTPTFPVLSYRTCLDTAVVNAVREMDDMNNAPRMVIDSAQTKACTLTCSKLSRSIPFEKCARRPSLSQGSENLGRIDDQIVVAAAFDQTHEGSVDPNQTIHRNTVTTSSSSARLIPFRFRSRLSQVAISADIEHALEQPSAFSDTCAAQSFAPVQLVPPEPREEAQACNSTADLRNISHGSHSSLARPAPNFAIDPATAGISLDLCQCATREDQTPSICSTTSTSYSGTIVGVDVDLKHGKVRPEHSTSLPMLV